MINFDQSMVDAEKSFSPSLAQLGLAHWENTLLSWLKIYAGLSMATLNEADPWQNVHQLLDTLPRNGKAIKDVIFAELLSRLDFLCWRVRAGNVRWQPLEQSFMDFHIQYEGREIRYWMWDSEYPASQVTSRWLLEHLPSYSVKHAL